MQLKLSWHTTGDELVFEALNPDLVDWFIHTAKDQNANKFCQGDQIIDSIQQKTVTDQLIEEEKLYIQTVNEIMVKLKLPMFHEPCDWHDQHQLNKLHKAWAKTRQEIPNLTTLLYKIDQRYYDAYQEMNCHIHLIENSFSYIFRDRPHWRVQNPWSDRAYGWAHSHLHVKYPGHGRNAFEKFECQDDDDSDLSNWDNIDGYIGIRLTRPYAMSPPSEFIQWCQQRRLVPHQHDIPLGNLSNWPETLAMARKIMSRNVTIKNNWFSLER